MTVTNGIPKAYLIMPCMLLLSLMSFFPVIGQVSFQEFIDPPTDSRPFARWWWNGNRITKNELARELDVLKKAGIGGVEINPIALPEGVSDDKSKPLVWLSKEWNEMVRYAAEEAKARDMVVDLLVGTGWPFGGEFLTEDQVIERAIVHRLPCKGGDRVNESLKGLYDQAIAASPRPQKEAVDHYEMLFIRLVPVNIESITDQIDLTDQFKTAGDTLTYTIPEGRYELIYGILQKGYRKVVHGAPGGAGNVMDHYRADVTQAYLDRLNRISQDTGVPLSSLIRALFCDSIELGGANWTQELPNLFFAEYGYRVEPWLPFIFYDLYSGYTESEYNIAFTDDLARIRYDYNRLLVNTFLKNFVQVFQQYCSDNEVLCRYQAYGFPWLLGILEGNMAVDIPESNNWLFASDMYSNEWNWHQGHGYMIWNLYASSAGHLTNKRIISVEAMTNTKGVFKASLEDIKQSDDMNFITGINHSVLHGYNYSPPHAGFPGWVRYGAYFSEYNTWWPYFPKWAAYNARLSYVFQHSDPVKKIAIVAPQNDVWANHGLIRTHFNTQPWYAYRLWEGISQAGSSCDYITDDIIKNGEVSNGQLIYGPMSFDVIMLASVESVEPNVAKKLADFVKSGGTLVGIDKTPNRSLSMKDKAQGDKIVSDAFNLLAKNYSSNFHRVPAPKNKDELLPWVDNMLKTLSHGGEDVYDVKIKTPNKNIFQIHKTAGDSDIYFFTNTNRSEEISFYVDFPLTGKTPWIWNPEDGTREKYANGKSSNSLSIKLRPLQSILLIFDPSDEEDVVDYALESKEYKSIKSLNANWQMTFKHVNGTEFTRNESNILREFGTSNDSLLHAFAGTVYYKTTFQSDGLGDVLRINNTNKGVVEVFLNNTKIGESWYGVPSFALAKHLNKGENTLEIKYTTLLSNYMMELKDPVSNVWTKNYKKIPSGIDGEVEILAH
ncbi:glycosyl hydrolase [Parapedobacter tibetensis]|uniref:glycosyl hydrolase n=1 Tax=Parapedobacter tibetensis TaxID=2972951 RepID=UPI00214DA8E1|nr:glycosyl hydrolase [Parapedobacter tibetensis]